MIPAPDATTLENLKYVTDLIKTEVNVKEIQVVTTEDSTIKLVKALNPTLKLWVKIRQADERNCSSRECVYTGSNWRSRENGQIILPCQVAKWWWN